MTGERPSPLRSADGGPDRSGDNWTRWGGRTPKTGEAQSEATVGGQ